MACSWLVKGCFTIKIYNVGPGEIKINKEDEKEG
jgi:hypothetical protein